MDEQLKHLFEYTKFHIGMYTTLVAAIVGVFANDNWKTAYEQYFPFMLTSVVSFLFAGAFGGLIASSIPYYRTFEEFMTCKLGPGSGKLIGIRAKTCTHVEHGCFWLGSLAAVFGLIYVTVSELP